ncbi:N-acetylmuramoyl-L-alanine amidase-like domain-containing protein [Burkholderia dolosa]|uniref:N-acetylmuramoyl-L-alanine amidase-like domain-containing protein n=1 Tax=Burkholderia dolosa TaxID=152500 RepID=UPI002445D472|nr:N-acetylmuramoyl-L-alanine amidase-like domain-containing protein [Burkholderia dolosa]
MPRGFVDDYVVSPLRTGNFIGIYAKADGLDVTHVGLFIDTPDGPMLRDASSKKANMKVVDSPFLEYAKHTPGIVVLRPREYGAASP